MRTNEEIVSIIESKMKEKELTLSELARRVGMAKSALSRYFNRTREFPLNRVEDFARVLDLDTRYILGFSEKSDIQEIYSQLQPARQKKVYSFAEHQLKEQNKVISLDEYKDLKIYSTVSAGTGVVDLDPHYIEETRYKGYIPPHDMAFKVSGDSMYPMFEDCEIVFVEKTHEIRSGQLGVVLINDEGFIKKVYKEEGFLRLVSLNKEYKDIVANDKDDVVVVGRIIL